MKVDSVECLKCAGTVVLVLLAAFLLWLFTTPVRAGELPEGLKEFEADVACSADLCVLPRNQFLAIVGANRKMQEAIEARETQTPKCATIEPEPKKEPVKKLPDGDGPKRGI